MFSIATSSDELDDLLDRLDALGLELEAVRSPTARRRVVVARPLADSPVTAHGLRAAGLMAVSRPDRGAALNAWVRDTEPVTVAGRVTLALAWSEHDRHRRPGLVELGHGGFGSGHHPTTRMVVTALAERIAGGERVLDVGCGSGVLALAAVALGAATAHGVDLKPEAVDATVANAALNGRADSVTASASLADLTGEFSVIVANISRAGVAAVAPDLVRLLAADGWLAVSGITPGQVDQVLGLLGPVREITRRIEGNWAVVVGALP